MNLNLNLIAHVKLHPFALLVALSIQTSVAHAAILELPGNVLHQYNAPSDPNVGIAINNPQNMGGGAWVGNGPTYPTGGSSFALDGNAATSWSAGTFGGGSMANVAVTRGYYGLDTNSFTNSPFGAVNTVRIIAEDYINDDLSVWISLPQQVKIAYATAGFYPGNGYSYNSDTLGVVPASWAIDAPILAVNGGTPNAISYGGIGGWIGLSGAFTGNEVINSHTTRGYVDVAVNIPAGATSILISFGQTTNSPGGLAIQEIQAALVPEPSTLSLGGLGIFGLMSMGRVRRRHALR